MYARLYISLALLPVALGLASPAWAHPEYRVTIVGPADSQAIDINNAGTVVGSFPFNASFHHAFLNRGKGMVDIGAPPNVDSRPVSINEKGQVLGNYYNLEGMLGGFVYYRGTRRALAAPSGYSARFTDINDSGYITAIAHKIDSFEGTRGLLRAPNGTYRDIGNLPFDDPLTNAESLNNNNRVTGASGPLTFPEQPLRAIVWAKGVMRDIGGFGWEPNSGTSINDCGQITGYASVPVGIHGRVAILYSKGRLIDIDGRPAEADRYSEGWGINNHGHVVGYADHLSGFVYRGRRMQSLNALVDPKLGWDIAFPRAINDSGQIAATAYRNGVQYAVRLDLIRPHLLQLPLLHADEGAPVRAAPLSPAQAAAEEKADTDAQAREVVRRIQQ